MDGSFELSIVCTGKKLQKVKKVQDPTRQFQFSIMFYRAKGLSSVVRFMLTISTGYVDWPSFV
jgi:hypothetical protein